MKVNIYVFRSKFIADFEDEKGKQKSALGEEEINEKLKELYEKTGKSLTQLVTEGVISISRNVWTKYGIVEGQYFSSLDKSKEETKTGKAPTKKAPAKKAPAKKEPAKRSQKPKTGDDGAVDVTESSKNSKKKKNDKDDKKGAKGIILRKVAPYVIAGAIAIGGLVLAGGAKDVARNNFQNTPENTPIVFEIEGQQYQQTYNTESEEATYTYQEPQTGDQSFEALPDDPSTTYRYTDQGSSVKYDDMDTQIQVINDACFGYQPCSLENLVVASDYNAIETISNMRNRVLNGSCDAATFMNNVVNYLFEGGTVFDGRVIKTFDSLSPYSQYIVLVSSQSILQLCPGYEHTTTYNSYNFGILVNSYEYMVDAVYRQLTNQYGRSM